jgi:hypothetical protein
MGMLLRRHNLPKPKPVMAEPKQEETKPVETRAKKATKKK